MALSKPKPKTKTVAKKAPPIAAKKAAPAPVAKKKVAAPVQADIEDEDTSGAALAEILDTAPTETVVDTVLAAFVNRVDFVIENGADTPENIAELWIHAKRMEQETINLRRALEDAMGELYPAEDVEGTATHELEGFEVKIAHKVTRSVDGEKLTALSEEYEIDEVIARLFRFKPELNLAVFRAEPEEMQELFAPVITTKEARPSFTITAVEQE